MAIVKRNNPNVFETLKLRVSKLDGLQEKVGWFDDAKYEDGTSVAYVASIQEFGSGPIPPRPFMRPTVAEDSQKWAKVTEYGVKRVVDGKGEAYDAMELLGKTVESDIVKTISKLTSPALSQLTIGMRAYKKLHPEAKITAATLGIVSAMLKAGTLDISGTSTKLLNDTGTMLEKINHKTEKP